MNLADNTPGLLSRQVVRMDGDVAVIVEQWDLTVPGCPMVAYRTAPEFERDLSAIYCRRTVRVPREWLDRINEVQPPA